MKDNGRTIGIIAAIVMVLQLLLIAVKECGFIDWAWGWVLFPLWMCATIITVLVLVTILTED